MTIPNSNQGGTPRNRSGIPPQRGGIPQRGQRPSPGIPRPNQGQGIPAGGSGQRPAPQRPAPQRPVPSRVEPPLPSPREDTAPHFTQEYDFESQKIETTNPRGPVHNPYDSEEDNTFSQLSIDDQIEDDYEDQMAQRDAAERKREERRRAAALQRELDRAPIQEYEDEYEDSYEDEVTTPVSLSDNPYEDESDYDEPVNTPRRTQPESAFDDSVSDNTNKKPNRGKKKKESKNRKDKTGQDVFINKDETELEPFGGTRRIKEGEYDKRKNLRKNAMIVKFVVIGLVLILVGLGLKNSFFPPATLSEEEVANIAISYTGATDFPMVRGEAYAKDFIEAYLTTDNAIANQVLGYFYNGNLAPGDNENRAVSSGYKQDIAYGPTVYSANPTTETSANFTVGSLVKAQASDGETPQEGSEPKWMFFNVNVYYDETTDRMYITPDSPTLVPNTNVGSISEVPKSAPIGTGDPSEALSVEVKSVVQGFIKAFAESTADNHSSLDQYIVSNPPVALLNGLGGAYVFSGSVDNAVQYTSYPTANENEAKIVMKVAWTSPLGAEDSNVKATYYSTYVLTLEKQSSKWLVSKFQPMLYDKADEK